MSTGIEAIAAERQRQIEKEGWTQGHDDEHTDESLALAAACYLAPFVLRIDGTGVSFRQCRPETDTQPKELPVFWPASWDHGWWKPKSHREDLVRAGALVAAEIDRIDRARAADEKRGMN